MSFYKGLQLACAMTVFSSFAFASDDQLSDISTGKSKAIVWQNTIPNMTSAVKNIDNITLHAYLFHQNAPETSSLSSEDKRQLSLLVYSNQSELSPFEVEMLTHQQLLNLGLSIKNVAMMEGISSKLESKQPLTKEETDLLKQVVNNLPKNPNVILAPMLSNLPTYVKENSNLFPPDALVAIRQASFQAVGLSKSEIAILENPSEKRDPSDAEKDAMQKMALLSEFPVGYNALDEKQVTTFKNHMNNNPKNFNSSSVERMNQTPSFKPSTPTRQSR